MLWFVRKENKGGRKKGRIKMTSNETTPLGLFLFCLVNGYMDLI